MTQRLRSNRSWLGTLSFTARTRQLQGTLASRCSLLRTSRAWRSWEASPSAVYAGFLLDLGGDASRLLKWNAAVGEPYIQGELGQQTVYERINPKTGCGNGFHSEMPMLMALKASESLPDLMATRVVFEAGQTAKVSALSCGAGHRKEGHQVRGHETLHRRL